MNVNDNKTIENDTLRKILPEITIALCVLQGETTIEEEEAKEKAKEKARKILKEKKIDLDKFLENENLANKVKKITQERITAYKEKKDIQKLKDSEVSLSAQNNREFQFNELVGLFDELILSSKSLEDVKNGKIVIFFDFKNFKGDKKEKLQNQLCLLMKCQAEYGKNINVQLREDSNSQKIGEKDTYSCEEAIADVKKKLEYLLNPKGISVGIDNQVDEGVDQLNSEKESNPEETINNIIKDIEAEIDSSSLKNIRSP